MHPSCATPTWVNGAVAQAFRRGSAFIEGHVRTLTVEVGAAVSAGDAEIVALANVAVRLQTVETALAGATFYLR